MWSQVAENFKFKILWNFLWNHELFITYFLKLNLGLKDNSHFKTEVQNVE